MKNIKKAGFGSEKRRVQRVCGQKVGLCSRKNEKGKKMVLKKDESSTIEKKK